MTTPLLSIRELVVRFHTADGVVHAVEGLDLDVHPGEVLGLVGESGSGKSAAMLAVLGLLPPPPACVVHGRVLLDGTDLLRVDRRT
ncbi:MAG: ATP-binding cassette domain-containing protein, partial [Euzebyales bacterium]|nr:ATP-binding cassette domain-containing protein [Euzebyales bacterium]